MLYLVIFYLVTVLVLCNLITALVLQMFRSIGDIQREILDLAQEGDNDVNEDVGDRGSDKGVTKKKRMDAERIEQVAFGALQSVPENISALTCSAIKRASDQVQVETASFNVTQKR